MNQRELGISTRSNKAHADIASRTTKNHSEIVI
jgi:hypothetical protein